MPDTSFDPFSDGDATPQQAARERNSRQQKQRVMLCVMLFMVFGTSLLLNALRHGWIASFDDATWGWQIEIAGALSVPFVVAFVVCTRVRTVVSRPTTVLFGAVAGMLSGFLFEPFPAGVVGASVGLWVAACGAASTRMFFYILRCSSIPRAFF